MQLTRVQSVSVMGLCLVMTGGAAESATRVADSGAETRQAAVGAFDSAEIHAPVVSRVRVTTAQSAALHAFVPQGTRAYFIGNPGDAEPDVLAWYGDRSGRLVAAIEITPAGASLQTDGVRVSVGPSANDKGAAIFAISTTQDVPALQDPDGSVRLQGASGTPAHAAAPLLAWAGSSHLVTLVSGAGSSLVDAQSIHVQVLDAAQKPVFSRSLPASGGAHVAVATTQAGADAPVALVNTGDTTVTVVTRALPPLSRAPGNDPDVRLVGPGQTVQGAPVRGPAGSWGLAFDAVPTPNLDDPAEPLAPGPIVLPESGVATIAVRSSAGLTASHGVGNIPAAALGDAPPDFAVSGSGSKASRVAIGAAGAVAIGAGVLILRDREGREQSRPFTVVPVRESILDDGARLTRVTPIRSGGLLAANFPPEPASPVGTEQDKGGSGTGAQPEDKSAGTTTTGDNGWKQPKECLCVARGSVEISNVRTSSKGTGIELTADLSVSVSVFTFGEEGKHEVTVRPGEATAMFRVRGDVETNREWFTAVDLRGSTAWQVPGGGKSVSLVATCPLPDKPPGVSIKGKLVGAGSWTEGSALDRVFRKEGGAGSATITAEVNVEGCGGKKLVANADIPIYYDGGKSAEKETREAQRRVVRLEEYEPPSIGADTSDPCQSKRSQLACFLACVGGKTAGQIEEAAQATDIRNPEDFRKAIQRCCPECERRNSFDAVFKALQRAAGALSAPGPAPPPPPSRPAPEGP